MKRIVLAILALSALGRSAAGDELEKNFTTPPEATRPGCYWYWMDGHITKVGITVGANQNPATGAQKNPATWKESFSSFQGVVLWPG